LEAAADWHELILLQHIMRPNTNGQPDL